MEYVGEVSPQSEFYLESKPSLGDKIFINDDFVKVIDIIHTPIQMVKNLREIQGRFGYEAKISEAIEVPREFQHSLLVLVERS